MTTTMMITTTKTREEAPLTERHQAEAATT